MKSISFDGVHCWDDLHLVLSEVKIPPAIPKTKFVDIPGGDGSVDLTETLGEPRFKVREATFTFSVLPTDDFEQKKTEFSNQFNGRRCRIVLDKDPDYYWVGRCSVNAYQEEKKIRKIVVRVTLDPYKYKNEQTTVTVPAGTDVAVTLQNDRKTVVPTITCTAETTIQWHGSTHTLNAGTHRILELALTEGENPLTVTSSSAVTITYQEGAL